MSSFWYRPNLKSCCLSDKCILIEEYWKTSQNMFLFFLQWTMCDDCDCDFTDNRCEEFWRWAPRRHERGTSHILAQIQLLHNTRTADASHPAKPLAQTPPKTGAVCFMNFWKPPSGSEEEQCGFCSHCTVVLLRWKGNSLGSFLWDLNNPTSQIFSRDITK